MKVGIMVMVLHNIMGVPETSVYVGVYSTAEVCQHNLQIFSAAEPTVELHCSEQPVLTW
jgi:hypothetical protein